MRTRRTTPLAPPSRRHQALRRVAVMVLFVWALVGGSLVARAYWRRATLAAAVQRGLQLLATAGTATQVAEALDEWQRQTAHRWEHRRDALIEHMLKRSSLEERGVRQLLTRVTGADYGDRREDWEKWFQTRQLVRRGQSPQVPTRQQVRLERRWKAPVGLTAWFSTILPLDGQIYVASLGAAFDDERDTADGIVRVDGRTGHAELIFQPPDGRTRDVLGVAAGDDCLFAACWNGLVYCVEPDGRLRWSARAGGPLAGPPMSLDVNRDGVSDAIVVTHDGRVVAVSGRTGRTVWVTPAPRTAAGRTRARQAAHPGATLAAGPLSADGSRDLIVTAPDGSVRVLAARTGALRWERTLPAGSVAGAVVCDSLAGGPPAYVGDRGARVWSLLRGTRGFELVLAADLLIRSDEGLVAALRTLSGNGRTPALVACPTGASTDPGASVCVLDPGVVRWRYAPGGAIWATPALADINGDGQTEIIVVSVSAADGQAAGVLTVLSSRGHCLRREVLPAPVECSPVVSDVDGDGRLEVLLADTAGWLHCFTTGRIGPVEWGLFGGDSRNTRNSDNAYAFGQTPSGRQWQWRPR